MSLNKPEKPFPDVIVSGKLPEYCNQTRVAIVAVNWDDCVTHTAFITNADELLRYFSTAAVALGYPYLRKSIENLAEYSYEAEED